MFYLYCFLIGLGAAVLDVLPMILKKLDPMFILSAGASWMVIAFLVPKARFLDSGWLNGILVSFLVVLPMAFLIFRLDKQALPQILGTTALLGACVGFLTGYLISG